MHGYALKAGPRKKHSPARSLMELGEEFGVDYRRLGRLIAADGSAPKPVLQRRCPNSCGMQKLYSLSDMRRWWSDRQAANTGV